MSSESGPVHGHGALLARFLWAMIGPIALLSLLTPLAKANGRVSAWDGVFAATVLLMIGGRYAEQKSGHGTTLYGEPSTWVHFRRYSARLLIAASALWGSARLVGHYLSNTPTNGVAAVT